MILNFKFLNNKIFNLIGEEFAMYEDLKYIKINFPPKKTKEWHNLCKDKIRNKILSENFSNLTENDIDNAVIQERIECVIVNWYSQIEFGLFYYVSHIDTELYEFVPLNELVDITIIENQIKDKIRQVINELNSKALMLENAIS